MDLFVDAIDSQLQEPEDYKVLVSPGDSTRKVESHLNKLITAATDLVSASNRLPAEMDYSVRTLSPTFSAKMAELSLQCNQAITGVDRLFRSIGADESVDVLSQDAFDMLANEVCLGLNVHRKDDTQTVSSFCSETHQKSRKKQAHKRDDGITGNVSEERSITCDPDRRLQHLTLEMRAGSYSRVRRHKQNEWSHLIDNFSMRLLYRPGIPKFNPIEPSISIAQPMWQRTSTTEYAERGYSHQFVPMVYPQWEYLNTIAYEKGHPNVLPHPYTVELNALEWSDTNQAHSHRGRKILGGGTLLNMSMNARGPSGPLGNCTMVQTTAELVCMISQLKQCSVIAIDVEHHNSQSYRGFVCLVQITGADMDYVVDPFGIFNEMWRLNEVTTDPRILKVMHGAEGDVLWLQRDFGVYIVNMFDTLKAAEVCAVSGGHSLSSLLRNFMGICLDKSYQLADWRIRPIPRGMLDYASADTHYLIDLYNVLKNRALELDMTSSETGVATCVDNRIQRIMIRSRGVCLSQYRDRPFNPVAKAFSALRKNRHIPNVFDYLGLNVLVNIISLRNYAARVLDESEPFLLPDYAAVLLAVAGSSRSNSQAFMRAANKHMSQLYNEIPYIVCLRNNIKDALQSIELSGVELTEPISVSSVEELLRTGSVKQAEETYYSCGDNDITLRPQRRAPQCRSRSASYIYNTTDHDSVKNALDVYSTISSSAKTAGPSAAIAHINRRKGNQKKRQSINSARALDDVTNVLCQQKVNVSNEAMGTTTTTTETTVAGATAISCKADENMSVPVEEGNKRVNEVDRSRVNALFPDNHKGARAFRGRLRRKMRDKRQVKIAGQNTLSGN